MSALSFAALFAIWAAPAEAFNYHIDIGVSLAINDHIASDIRAQQNRSSSAADDEEDATSAPFRYEPSKARTRANLAQFIAKTRSVDPAGADRPAATFASTDLISAMDKGMREVGLRADDVADAYTLWWVVAWYAVQGVESVADPDTLAAAPRQAARAFEASGTFDDAADATRREWRMRCWSRPRWSTARTTRCAATWLSG